MADLYEGPPGLVHGGIIATLLDEIMSKTVRALGVRAVTRKIEVDYLRPVHSHSPLRMEARLVRKDGRKHWTEARLLDREGLIRAQSNGLFIEIPGQI